LRSRAEPSARRDSPSGQTQWSPESRPLLAEQLSKGYDARIDRSPAENLTGKPVLVTGSSGFLGARVLRRLGERGLAAAVGFRSAQHDVRDRDAIRAALHDARPDAVIHLAAVVEGIGANMVTPGYRSIRGDRTRAEPVSMS
jgi:NAD dependent epimerase/dehydratase family